MAMQLNPDKTVVKAIRNRLKITKNFCPCLPETEWNENTLCPCKAFREDLYCCCQLYVKMEELIK